MPLSIALFVYGPPVLMVLVITYLMGCGSERRRSRDLYYTNEQLNHAVKKSYRLGLRRGYDRGVFARRHPVTIRRAVEPEPSAKAA